jgi:hypothetical protein
MRLRAVHFNGWMAAGLVLLCSASVFAQGPPPGPPPHHGGGPMEFDRVEMGLGGKTVTGAPYSAQVVNQRSQTLSDGTHVTQQSSGAVYRDTAGRTRREMTMPALGSLTGSAQAPRAVFISDPVAGFHYVLHADTKAVDRMPIPPPRSADSKGAKRAAGERGARNGEQVTTEALGTQTIEGVSAEGTRTTKTIPAGTFGNDKAIQIVIERWYSTDLQTAVLIKRSDPWMGESIVRLTNITRAEPSSSLFSVPADYKVSDRPAPAAFGPRGGPGPAGAPKD